MIDFVSSLSRRDFLRTGAMTALTPTLLGLASTSLFAADPYADAVLVNGEPPQTVPGAFTVVVLPDTQKYCRDYPEHFMAQTKWIVEHLESRNIGFVLHLGDITDNNVPEQWDKANLAMRLLDGRVPYCLVPGNHDYSKNGRCQDRTTLINDYFPVSRFQSLPTFGGTYDKEPNHIENSYHLFEVMGKKILVLALEFGPRRDVVRWANEIVSKYANHSVILITHAYMYFDDTRYDWKKYGPSQNWNPHSYGVAKSTDDDVMDGEELWMHLVSRHPNFMMTLNGHVIGDGLGRLDSTGTGEQSVHQMLVNFQMRPEGGDGWLRMLEFRPDQTVQVYDYSPTRNQHNTSPQNQFTLQLP